MLAMATGGVMTSCSPNDGNEPTPPIPPIVVPVDTVAQSATQKALVDMKTKLGLASVRTTDKVDAKSIIRKGDVVEFGYHDKNSDYTYKFKINESLSTKDKMVYDGAGHDNITGADDVLRRTISSTSTGLLFKDESESNGEFVPDGTREYVANADGTFDEYFIKSDGTKEKGYTYSVNNPTSLVKTSAVTGTVYKVDNITITQK